MQLLLRRRILMGTPTSKFALWAKFDLAPEEQRLIRHYGVSNCYLTIEASRRDLWRAAVISFFIALIGVGGLSAALPSLPTTLVQTQRGMVQQYIIIPWWVWMLFFAFVFGIATWIIYEQLRLAIRIQDMLDGREFKNKSLVLMARRERQMIGYAHAFVQLLEKLQNWEGTDIIEIGEETEPALRLVTDAYNAAA
jgi:hypothetical protein